MMNKNKDERNLSSNQAKMRKRRGKRTIANKNIDRKNKLNVSIVFHATFNSLHENRFIQMHLIVRSHVDRIEVCDRFACCTFDHSLHQKGNTNNLNCHVVFLKKKRQLFKKKKRSINSYTSTSITAIFCINGV